MYAFESSGSRKGLHALVIGSSVAAFLLFSISTQEGMPFPYLFQFGAVLCLVAAVYLLTRYSLRIYRYALEPNGIRDSGGREQVDLIITRIVGRQMVVETRVSLRDIDRAAVAVVRRADRKAYADLRAAYGSGWHIFRYENTPLSAVSCYIPIPEERAVVVIPADERMVQILQDRS